MKFGKAQTIVAFSVTNSHKNIGFLTWKVGSYVAIRHLLAYVHGFEFSLFCLFK